MSLSSDDLMSIFYQPLISRIYVLPFSCMVGAVVILLPGLWSFPFLMTLHLLDSWLLSFPVKNPLKDCPYIPETSPSARGNSV